MFTTESKRVTQVAEYGSDVGIFYGDRDLINSDDEDANYGRINTYANVLLMPMYIFIAPNTIAHELSHFLMACLLGCEVHAAVFWRLVGLKYVLVDFDDQPRWKWNVVYAAPLLCLSLAFVSFSLSASFGGQSLLNLLFTMWGIGFIVVSIPDQVPVYILSHLNMQ